MIKLDGIAQLERDLKKGIKDLREEGAQEMKKAASVILEEHMIRTPVWSGYTVSNYRVTAGSPSNGPSVGTRGKGGTPGTGGMVMGVEPNRGRAEATARASLSAVSGKKLQSVHLTNTADSDLWDLVDNGAAPSRTAARNPGGVSKLAFQAIKRKLTNFE